MLHASTQQLIRKLYELTSAGSLAWTEGEKDTSRLDTEGYVVEVAASPASLRLLRADGRELENATADDLASADWPGGDGTYATRVAEMAGRAHRIALGAERAIATIMSALSAPTKTPKDGTADEPVATFGATDSFAKASMPARPEAAAPSVPKRVAPDMLSYGISARSVQGVEQSSAKDLQRLTSATSSPKPVPVSGPNIYKPWN